MRRRADGRSHGLGELDRDRQRHRMGAVGLVLWNRFGRGSVLDKRMGGDVAKGVDDARAETDLTRAKDGRETGGKV